jgi:hypothetical protein
MTKIGKKPIDNVLIHTVNAIIRNAVIPFVNILPVVNAININVQNNIIMQYKYLNNNITLIIAPIKTKNRSSKPKIAIRTHVVLFI